MRLLFASSCIGSSRRLELRPTRRVLKQDSGPPPQTPSTLALVPDRPQEPSGNLNDLEHLCLGRATEGCLGSVWGRPSAN